MAKKKVASKKTTAKRSKIVTLATGEPQSSDAERLQDLRARMSPSDRENYDHICKAIEISLETGRLSVFPQLVKQKEEIEKRYELGEEDSTVITWDDAALGEAANG